MALTSAGADSTRIYDELLVTTLEHIHPGIVENEINAHPVASMFLGRIGAALSGKIGEDGAPVTGAEAVSGESIRANLKLGKNGSGKWMASGYDTLNMDTSDTARGSRANFKLFGSTVVISGSEMRKNSGDAAVANLLMYKEEDSVSSSVDSVAEAMLSTSVIPNAVTSLDDVISANDSLQGFSGATFTAWNSRGVSAKGTAPGSVSFASGSFASQGLADMRAAWVGASEGSIMPKAILTTDLVYQYYEGSLTPNVRFEDVRMGDIGFQALKYKGAPMFHDPYVASGTMYFINTDYLNVKHLPGALFGVSPMERGQNQDAFVAHVLFEGNFCCTARKHQNKLTGITA